MISPFSLMATSKMGTVAVDGRTKAFDAAATKLEALDARARALDDAVAAGVQLYRQENAALRTVPAPAYFSAPPPGAGPSFDALAGAAALFGIAIYFTAKTAQAVVGKAVRTVSGEDDSQGTGMKASTLMSDPRYADTSMPLMGKYGAGAV